MRFLSLLILALLLGGSATVQAQATRNGWSLALGAEALRFSSAARDTVAEPEAQATLGPTKRWGFQVALARRIGAWEPAIELGWADGDVEATNSAVSLTDKTFDMSRLRIAPMLARRIVGIDRGELLLAVGPTLDIWAISGYSTRARVGPTARAVLRLEVGPVSVENGIAFSFSGSPYTQDEMPEGVVRRSLRTFAVGMGLRVPL